MQAGTAPDGTDVWVLGDGALLAISDEATFLVRAPANQLDTLLDELLIEGVPADVRLSNVRKIPHGKVIAVFGNETRLKAEIRYQSLGAALTSHGMANEEFLLADRADFDALMDAFRRHFGRKATLRRKVHSPLRAIVAPAMLGASIVAATWVFAGGLGDVDSRTSSRRVSQEIFMKIVDTLGPVGVVAVGVVGLILTVRWGVKCYRDPPTLVRVSPGR